MDATELNAMYAGKLDELTKVYEKTITMLKIAKEPKNTTEEEIKSLHDELIIDLSLLKQNLLRKISLSELFQQDSEFFKSTKEELDQRVNKMKESLNHGKEIIDKLEKETNNAEFVDKLMETYSSLENSQAQQKKIENLGQKLEEYRKQQTDLQKKQREKMINYKRLIDLMESLKKK